jgi:nucleotide-binding universal stress UspA family protein
MINQNILIAVDGSECSKNAANVGIKLAKELSASVTLICVMDMSNAVSSTAVNGFIDNEMIKAFQAESERIVKEIADKHADVNIKTQVVEGIPQNTINGLALNEKSDMIIMGTHGRTGLKHMLMGSVAEYVIRHAEVPVLVVPESKK